MTIPILSRLLKRNKNSATKMYYCGNVYEAARMPKDIAKQHKANLKEYGGEVTTKMTSSNGEHYMVKDGKAYRFTGERSYPPIDWSRLP